MVLYVPHGPALLTYASRHTFLNTHTPIPTHTYTYMQAAREAQRAALALLERLDGRCCAFREQIRT